MTEDVFDSINGVSSHALIYLYTQNNTYKILNAFPYNTPFYNRLEVWLKDGRCFAEEDLGQLYENGYTKDDFQEIYDKAEALCSAFSIPYEEGKGIDHISAIFYRNNMEKCRKLLSDLNQIYLDLDEELRSKRYLITRDLMGNNKRNDFLEKQNTY